MIGVEPDKQRVDRGKAILDDIGYDSLASLHHIEHTAKLPFEDAVFDLVIAHAVLDIFPLPGHHI